MEFKRSMLILIMAIFLASIAGVCAGDVNDMIVASEDANQMELSSNDVITEDNLKTSEDIVSFAQTDDESISDDGEGNYTDLRNDINNGGSLTKSYYRYCDGDGETIEITAPMTVNGNGAIIDMARSAIRAFNVSASGVTIKDLTIKNANCDAKGGAIYFNASGNVRNCNFINNTASAGGALFFNGPGNVADCNFTDNKVNASRSNGGAVYFKSQGDVRNCNFIDNMVTGTTSRGGAINIDSGNVTNCNFTSNFATYGGGAVYFTSTKYPGIVENCNFTNNTARLKGGAVYSSSKNTTSISTVRNCSFANNKASDVNGYGGATLMYYGLVDNCDFTSNAAGFRGGALSFESASTVANCNFTGNKATHTTSKGGAIYFYNPGTVINCNFTDNSIPYYGGAIYFETKGNVTESSFTGNNATSGSAIYFWATSAIKSVSNSTFLDNRADAQALEITKNENNITITFTGQDNLLNAIFSKGDVSFSNVTYWGVNGINNTGSSTQLRSNREAGQNITVAVIVNDSIVFNDVKITDANGTIVLVDMGNAGSYTIVARHYADYYYTEAEKIVTYAQNYVNVTSQMTSARTVNITAKSSILNEIIQGSLQFIVSNGDVIAANYAGNGTWWATYTFAGCGSYGVNASYVGLDNVTVNNATITVNKIKTQLVANAITATYNKNKNLVITLKDADGKALKGIIVTVNLNGAKTFTTDKNGQIKINVAKLVPKTYTAKIAFNGNDVYDKSAKNVKVVVKKAKPKIIAKKKTFKSKKVKKYTITLKNNVGKAIKKAKVTIKIKKKTYKAKTNAKGKATFKIKKLTKKGKYKATIKYNGNKYYNKVTKKVKIVIK